MTSRTPITGPAAWYGRDYQGRNNWIYRLTEEDVAEIDRAVLDIRKKNLPVERIRRSDFPLPNLSEILKEIQREVVHGRGFALIKGLPVAHYSRQESIIAYWGLGTYLGDAVAQNAKGHLLGHVKDLGNDPFNPLTRIYTTNYLQPYHTDSCDVVGLLCLQTAKAGGLSSFSSSTTIYNEMLKKRPDLVEALFEPFYVDRKGEVPAGKQAYYQMAVFHYYGGFLTTIYARDFINAAQRHPEVPRLAPLQIEALDLFDELAASQNIRLDMALQRGDIQLLHNHQIVHSRTSYEDHPEPERRRHLLRLWLSQPRGRPLPPVFGERYANLEGPRRGGIYVPGVEESVPFEAE